MKSILLIILCLSTIFSLFSQVECPEFGSKKSKSRLSNTQYLHYGIEAFALTYADKPYVFSTLPHFGVMGEINILRHFSMGGAMGSQFKMELNTDIPVFREPYLDNIYFKFMGRAYLNRVFEGFWIGYAQTMDKTSHGIKLLEIGFANKVSKVGVINYFAGTTVKKMAYISPRFLHIGISLGVLRKKSVFKNLL